MLENIGFYTLSDARCANASASSPLWRAEIILTDRCNFRCPYCRGLRRDLRGEWDFDDAFRLLYRLSKHGLRNVRFSGGEPTSYGGLDLLVRETRRLGAEHIAISTNGSAPVGEYTKLIGAGVNDFSISLDACCAATGDQMCGVKGKWEAVVNNIRHLARLSYVTVGIVLSEGNLAEAEKTVALADSLGVRDIRIIPAAQFSRRLNVKVASESKYPILRYRLDNMRRGVPVRGLEDTDNRRCPLVLDDVAFAGGKHFPCIIYLR